MALKVQRVVEKVLKIDRPFDTPVGVRVQRVQKVQRVQRVVDCPGAMLIKSALRDCLPVLIVILTPGEES